METQEQIDRLAAEIYRDKVLRARAAEPGDKLIDGLRLFESALVFTKAGVAEQLGTDDEATILRELRERFERVRALEERGLYFPVANR